MPKPQLKNIEEHLQFLVGKRNPFIEPDHLEKNRLYIAQQFDGFNLSVTQEAVDFENSRSFKYHRETDWHSINTLCARRTLRHQTRDPGSR